MSIIEKKSDLHNNMVTWRHHLHQRPELSFKEEITSDYIASVLQSHDIEIHRGLAVTGIVATIHGNKPICMKLFKDKYDNDPIFKKFCKTQAKGAINTFINNNIKCKIIIYNT